MSPNPGTASLQVLGKWGIVKDSLQWDKDGISHLQTDSDYYDFKSTGIVVIKEGAQFDSANFSFVSNSQLRLEFKGPTLLTTDQLSNLNIKGVGVDRLSGNYAAVISGHAISLKNSQLFIPPTIGLSSVRFNAVISLRR
jgi:hypothetical protein